MQEKMERNLTVCDHFPQHQIVSSCLNCCTSSLRQTGHKRAKDKDINQDLDDRELSLKKGTSSPPEAPISESKQAQNQPS